MIKEAIDFILHVDKYIGTFISIYGSFTYLILFLIVFIETGFVFVPFLPGDSLIFITGTFAAAGALNIFVAFIIFSTAAILGDILNYFFGSYFGEKVFSRYIKPEHMDKTKEFYHKHGKKTIILARFVPIVRTVAPFVAGVGKMDYKVFISYNIIGGIVWAAIFSFAGYYFGSLQFVKNNLTLITILIIFVSFIPAFIEYFKHKRNKLN